jgi:hypothetical protein
MKSWTIETTEFGDVYIHLPEFTETYFGDVDTLTPEEWTVIRQISATPALLAACQSWIAWAEQTITENPDGSISFPSVTAELARTRAALARIDQEVQ